MKKLMKMIMSAMGLCLLVTGCNNNNEVVQNNGGNNNQNVQNNQVQSEQNTQKEEKKINEEYDVRAEIDGIIENTRLCTIENLEEKEEVSKIDFSDLKGVTYEHIEEITENEITEVWLVKMSNFNQYDKIVSKLNNSLEELKTKYKDNKYITSILSSKDNIRIQEKEGIVMAVFAPDAGALISGIEQSFVEEELPIVEENSGDESGEVIEEPANTESGEVVEENTIA